MGQTKEESCRQHEGHNTRRFGLSKLKDDSEDDEEEAMTRVCFKIRYVRKKELWNSEGSIEENWASMKLAMCKTAEVVIGTEKRKHPDWFRESETTLKTLFEERSKLYVKWLSTGHESDNGSLLSCIQMPDKQVAK